MVPLSLSLPITQQTLVFCKDKITKAKAAIGDHCKICTAIYANKLDIQPFGTIPFAQAVAFFHEISMICKDFGADMIMIHRAKTLIQARSGILGARASDLPVILSMEPVGEGETLEDNTNILSAFAVTVQLGIKSFGFISSSVGIQLEGWACVSNYTVVPFFSISHNLTGSENTIDSDLLMEKRSKILGSYGITGIGLQKGTLSHINQMLPSLPSSPPSVVNYTDLWSASDTHFHYLDNQLELSPPIDCQYDMADDILEAERQGRDVLCIEVDDADVAYAISLNNHLLSNLPVAFFSHQEDALETALFYYNGKAIIDSRSPICPQVLDRLAKKFGAVIL